MADKAPTTVAEQAKVFKSMGRILEDYRGLDTTNRNWLKERLAQIDAEPHSAPDQGGPPPQG